ncbi:MAG: hypothetical protein KDI01_02885 [Halioglobus sp.]|nr:hypothetical protein [Halioglobus sp.]
MITLDVMRRVVESPEFQRLAPGAELEAREAYAAVHYPEVHGVATLFDGDGVRIDPPGAARWVPQSIRDAHGLVVGLQYIDEPVTGFDAETNAEFQIYANRVNAILDAIK